MFLIILESILPTHAWLVAQSCRTLWPHGLQPARLLCPWDYPSKNTRVGCHFLLRRIFLTQGSNLHLPALAGRFSPTEPAGKPSCYTPKTFTLGSVRKTTSAGVHGRTVWTCGSLILTTKLESGTHNLYRSTWEACPGFLERLLSEGFLEVS